MTRTYYDCPECHGMNRDGRCACKGTGVVDVTAQIDAEHDAYIRETERNPTCAWCSRPLADCAANPCEETR